MNIFICVFALDHLQVTVSVSLSFLVVCCSVILMFVCRTVLGFTFLSKSLGIKIISVLVLLACSRTLLPIAANILSASQLLDIVSVIVIVVVDVILSAFLV